MDARNAVEPAANKAGGSAGGGAGGGASGNTVTGGGAAASSVAEKRSGGSGDKTNDKAGENNNNHKTSIASRSPVLSKTSPASSKETKPGGGARASAGHAASTTATQDEDAAGESEAETVVPSGKDGYSPSKVRNVKHEAAENNGDDASAARRDKSTGKKLQPGHGSSSKDRDGDGRGEKDEKGDKSERHDGRLKSSASGADGASLAEKKKRLQERREREEKAEKAEKSEKSEKSEKRPKDPVSSSLSSASTSPRHSSRPAAAGSDSEPDTRKLKSPKDATRQLPAISEKSAQKRKAPKADSDDEGETRKVRRQRTSGGPGDAAPSSSKQASRDAKPSKSRGDSHSHTRSESPHARTTPGHRRSTSSQLPNQSNGLGHKKKRVPAPLTTDYHSDDSSAGGSPYQRGSKLRTLTTPATAESAVSPAKAPLHRKHLDAHGQTPLAKACARGEYELVKQRLEERPDDLDFPDYAGNTPLQVASLNGHARVVKLLIDSGCNVDCMNFDRETPLLDAVENGHVEVVRLLLNAGVNPRKPNLNGDEPLDLIPDDLDNAEEIRSLLLEAKRKMGGEVRNSEERHTLDKGDGRSSAGPESPRRSPGISAPAPVSRRGLTVRANKTSNSQLYTSLDVKTLRQAASRGDVETVTRVLEVLQQKDDPEAMVNAARGGHDIVVEMLLALGNANPDPPPLPSLPPTHGTPMLAAIGQAQTLKVIKLLLEQPGFDPTKTLRGDHYFEIARRRDGPNWKEEEQMLKAAFNEWKKTHKETTYKEITKTKSPQRREQERESKRPGEKDRDKDRDDDARAAKRKAVSPTRDADQRKKLVGSKTTSPKDMKTKNRSDAHEDALSIKKGTKSARKDDRLSTVASSDREVSPSVTVKAPASKKRTESDLPSISSEGEPAKPPRKKLVSRKELNREKEEKMEKEKEKEKEREKEKARDRRASLASSSPRDGRSADAPEGKRPLKDASEKARDRTKSLKQEHSSERGAATGELSSKKRSAASPAPSASMDRDESVPAKKRRLEGTSSESKERKPRRTDSPEERHRKPGLSKDASTASAKVRDKDRDDDHPPKPKRRDQSSERDRRDSIRAPDKSIHVKSEDADVEMSDVPAADGALESRSKHEKLEQKKRDSDASKKKADEQKRRDDDGDEEDEEETTRREAEEAKQREEQERKRLEEERQKKAEEERLRKAEEERRLKEEEERKIREEEERRRKEEEDRRQKEEEERRRKEEEEERKRKEEEDRIRKEEEERQRLEAEKRRLEEEERLRKEEEERRRREEEERKKREEEERLRREQLEREAAEEARRKREEEERKERERREELKRKREAEALRIWLEQERVRLSKLPPLLRWLDTCPNPKTFPIAYQFRSIPGVRYDTIRWGAPPSEDPREQWLLNVHVALLLGEKDLSLSRCRSQAPFPCPLNCC